MRKTEVLKTEFAFRKFACDALPPDVFAPDFDDSDWRTVRVPHDWGIEGDFSADNDPSYRTIVADGIKTPILQTGRSGGLPTVGEGVYRKWVEVDGADCHFLELDGVMWQSTVYVNGIQVGGCHFGYKSYEVDISDYVVRHQKNLIAVHAVVFPDCSRWYSGAGLYRNIRLVSKPRQHIAYNGVCIRTTYLDDALAILHIRADIVNGNGYTATVTSPDGRTFTAQTDDDLAQLSIDAPMRWDMDTPHLYQAQITLDSGDSLTVPFGLRDCAVTKDGFFLNGKKRKLNGVCQHHDLGSIGAAVNVSAMRRQLEILKGMGVNAVRTSHNPPAPELLDLCDRMGLVVMDEFFDEWRIPKVENGYAKYFDEHAITDLTDIIKRDRNHPCVVLWSIGNEVGEEKEENGWKIARRLCDAVRAADPTRPTTQGMCFYPLCFDTRVAMQVDVAGLNYKPKHYAATKEQYPNLLLVGSETASCISTRDMYHLPAAVEIGEDHFSLRGEDLTVSDYGLCAPFWANYAEFELAAQQDHPDNLGEFIWTGFDYLGEPTPYYSEWPSRSSYFGVVDLAGLPKNRYYLYRSVWTDTPTLHIFPHWNWEGHEGETVPVHIYTNYDEVELFVNGVSQGKRRHRDTRGEEYDKFSGAHLERFRLMWNDTVYQPGEITAVAYQNGVEVERKTVKTAGAPHHIALSAYSQTVAADGESLNYITAAVVDKDGNVCPHADNRLTFTVSGAGAFVATDAGDQRETETFLRPDKKALAGKLVCCVRAADAAGTVTVTATADTLASATLSFETKSVR